MQFCLFLRILIQFALRSTILFIFFGTQAICTRVVLSGMISGSLNQIQCRGPNSKAFWAANIG